MKKAYRRPEMNIVKLADGMTAQRLRAMSDEALSAYLASPAMQQERRQYRLGSEMAAREIAGERVLIPMGERMPGEIGRPNASCQFLLRLFTQPRTAQEAAALCRQEFNGIDERIEQDVREYIASAVSAGILEEV